MRGATIGCALLATLATAAACSRYGMSGAPATGSVPLEGTTWSLVEVGGQPARAAGNDGTPSLRLDAAEKRASGNTGCNSFAGGYQLGGAALRFGALISTRRACLDPALNQQESTYLRALDDTRSWRVTGDTLVLSGDAGVAARFVAQPAR
jgi:heat shock protein HslJ